MTRTTTATTTEPSGPHRARDIPLRRRPLRSVRARILVWVVMMTALGLTGAGTAAYVVQIARIDQRIDASIAQEIEEFREFQRTGVDPDTGRGFTSLDRLLEVALRRNVPNENERILAIVNGETRFVQGKGDGLRLETRPAFLAAVDAVGRSGFGSVQVDGEPVRFAVLDIRMGEDRGRYVVTSLAAREHAELADAMRVYAVVALVSLLVLTGVAWLAAGRLLAPLRTLRRTAQQISDHDLQRRIAVQGDDDLSELARTFNAMLDRLEAAFTAQREFVDDAGHELRTPLTILRGQLELLDVADPREVAETRALLLDEVDRMGRLVEELLLLAKSERPDFLRPQPVHLGRLVDDVVDKVRGLGPRQWMLDARPDAVVVADAQRLTQALVGLAHNAVKVTGPGDTVAVGAAVDGGTARLWVRDSGPGVQPGDAARIFTRFQRGDTGRRTEGSGLGLAIVAAIAAAHGGRADVRSRPGAGAMFVVELPVATRDVPAASPATGAGAVAVGGVQP